MENVSKLEKVTWKSWIKIKLISWLQGGGHVISSQDVQKGKNKITWSFALDWHTADLEFRSFSVILTS